jgi:DNA-directed RNA polymerase specialized sigma24 family protein
MSSVGSVTAWLQGLKAGEEQALAKLFTRYWPLLVGLARKKLGASRKRAADEEDVAQKAFWGFCQSFKSGHVPRLENREDFLKLLTLIVARKAATQIAHQARAKRGAGQVQGESALKFIGQDGMGLEYVAATVPGPEDEAIAKDAYDHYLNSLPAGLRDFAEEWLAGTTQETIAQRKQCSLRTVERKIKLIRYEWSTMTDTPVA